MVEVAKGYKKKVNGDLYERDRERFNALLTDLPPNVRAYISCSNYSEPSLMIDIHYSVGDYSVQYIKQSLYFGQTPTPNYKTYTKEEFEAMELEMDMAKKLWNESESRYRSLANIVIGR